MAERLELAELLWTSIAQTPEEVPVTAAQRAELDRRLDDAERDGGGGIAWEEVVARLGMLPFRTLTIADPAHPEQESTLRWVGGRYDPDESDPNAVTFDDPRKRWKKAFAE